MTEEDQAIGTMEKMEAHEKGLLHRAFSIFIFNSQQELLIHQRAYNKYHSGGLWTNTCCSHPRDHESTLNAANRRLFEEMGLHCQLSPLFSFIYKAQLDNNLIEHELDHVFVGLSDNIPKLNKEEVNAYNYLSLDQLQLDTHERPNDYTAWFKLCLMDHGHHFRTFLERS